MDNPWKEIDLNTYENHMKSNDVFQLQTLNAITGEQLSDYNYSYIGILGIAGGNGLECIDKDKTSKVYGFDISKNYLEA
ncbi:MAG: methyltransferase type 11, partial [Bacillota bacterium]